MSVNGKLFPEMVQNLVRRCSQTAGVGENKVGSHEEVWEIVCRDVAGDGLVVTGGASVF